MDNRERMETMVKLFTIASKGCKGGVMATKEVENGLVWKVQCQECEANLSARGIKSIPMAEDFMTKHSEETGHTLFDMDVLAHTICVKVIDAGKGEPCGNNMKVTFNFN